MTNTTYENETAAGAVSDGELLLAELRDHAHKLAHDLPGSLRRIRVGRGDASIELEWQEPVAPVAPAAAYPPPPWVTGAPAPAAPAAAAAPAAPAAPADEPQAPQEPRAHVASPMVGTFYVAPEPGAEPFVSVGDHVDAGATVGIVEAMKLLNPVAAEVSGTVVEVLAENGEPVEFDQPLIAIAPDDPSDAA